MTLTTAVAYEARTESPLLQLGESSDSQVSAKSRREPGAPGSTIWIAPKFQSFTDIERVVQAVNELPQDAFRYPIGYGGSKELLPRGVRFNVLMFAEKLDALLDLLEAAATRTWDRFQTEALARFS
jgi:hypothetical protein